MDCIEDVWILFPQWFQKLSDRWSIPAVSSVKNFTNSKQFWFNFMPLLFKWFEYDETLTLNWIWSPFISLVINTKFMFKYIVYFHSISFDCHCFLWKIKIQFIHKWKISIWETLYLNIHWVNSCVACFCFFFPNMIVCPCHAMSTFQWRMMKVCVCV